jgi:hypothetical protein
MLDEGIEPPENLKYQDYANDNIRKRKRREAGRLTKRY